MAALAVTAVPLHAARLVALIAFTALLFVLSVGLLRAHKRAQRDETDVALEIEFLRLEREVAEHQAVRTPGADDEARS